MFALFNEKLNIYLGIRYEKKWFLLVPAGLLGVLPILKFNCVLDAIEFRRKYKFKANDFDVVKCT